MKRLIYLIFIAGAMLLASCKDSWFTINPQGEASLSTLQNKHGIDLLLIGAYADIDGVVRRASLNQGWSSAVSNWVWGSVGADDAYKGSNIGDQANINDVSQHSLASDNGYVSGHWQVMYDGIVRCNYIMQTLKLATGMSDADKIEAEAETRFLRAHWYVELTQVHGKVPWIDENTANPTIVPNDHLVWPEIQTDMQFAIDNLAITQKDKGRPTKWAAKTYMARIYLLQGNYTAAMPLLRDVYTNGGFTLVPQFNQNYLTAYDNNSESIFEIQYSVNSGFDPSLANYADALNQPSFKSISNFHQPSHNLVSAHRVNAAGLPLNPDPLTYSVADILPVDKTGKTVAYTGLVDPRLDWAIARPGVPDYDWGVVDATWIRDYGNGGPYFFKKSSFLKAEKLILSSTTGRPGANANNYRKFRLGMVILWLAECEAEVGSLHNATLLVNQIRNRAKNSAVVMNQAGTAPAANYLINPYPADFATQAEARLAIRTEERIEFSGDGLRFFDLVRWGIAGPVLNKYMSVEATQMSQYIGHNFVVGQHEIAPIPLAQIDLSKTKEGVSVLTQNPGY